MLLLPPTPNTDKIKVQGQVSAFVMLVGEQGKAAVWQKVAICRKTNKQTEKTTHPKTQHAPKQTNEPTPLNKPTKTPYKPERIKPTKAQK